MKELIKLLDTPEHREIATKVVSIVKSKIIKKNYFGWTYFIEDLLVDLIGYMIADKFAHTIGGYVNCGMQSAIDHCRYCNAKCRKENYQLTSLDDEDSYIQIEDPDSDLETQYERKEHMQDIYREVQDRFGKELADQLKPIIYGEDSKLERKVLQQCKSEEFREFLEELM